MVSEAGHLTITNSHLTAETSLSAAALVLTGLAPGPTGAAFLLPAVPSSVAWQQSGDLSLVQIHQDTVL